MCLCTCIPRYEHNSLVYLTFWNKDEKKYLRCVDEIFLSTHALLLISFPLGDYSGPCPQDWMFYRNNCYWFSNESKSWKQSQASCMSKNSSLLKIYSRVDQVKSLTSFPVLNLWVQVLAHQPQWCEWNIDSMFYCATKHFCIQSDKAQKLEYELQLKQTVYFFLGVWKKQMIKWWWLCVD